MQAMSRQQHNKKYVHHSGCEGYRCCPFWIEYRWQGELCEGLQLQRVEGGL